MTLPVHPNPISLGQIANEFGCWSGYSIIGNVSTATIGTSILFSVTSLFPAENLFYEILAPTFIPPSGTPIPTSTPTPTPILPSSVLVVTPPISSGSITLAGGIQATTGTFVLSYPLGSGTTTKTGVIQVTKPANSSTLLSASSFSLSPGQTATYNFTCYSPPTHTGTSYIYTFTVLETGFSGISPTHVHSQNY